MPILPSQILTVLLPFAKMFALSKTFSKGLFLMMGALLCRGGVTVCGALRALFHSSEECFGRYHKFLSRDRYDLMQGGKILLDTLIETFCPDGPITIALDDTLERRRGKKIKAKGRFKDPVDSSAGKIVTSYGLRWMPVMLLTPIPFIKRMVALPFLTVLTKSEKRCKEHNERHKSPQKLAGQVVSLLRRWLPSRQLRLVVDAGYACSELVRQCIKHDVTLATRLRVNARLFELPPPSTGRRGRPRTKGKRLGRIPEVASGLSWATKTIRGYKGVEIVREVGERSCLWAPAGQGDPIHIRIVFSKDPEEPKENIFALMTTDFDIPAEEVVEMYIARWSQEVTHREAREYCGVETQRQWSDLAIARTTPLLFGLYSLVFLMANAIHQVASIEPASASWYQKEGLTFSDLLRTVRGVIQRHLFSQRLLADPRLQKYPLSAELQDVLLEMIEAA